jgi:Txe/YoeB family toxin of Txe-Axe toxin-antitoxin module
MPIVITPEVGVPLPLDTTPEEISDFRKKAHVLFNTVQDMVSKGLEVEITPEDKAISHTVAASGKFPRSTKITPGAIINLEAILSEWDGEVLDVSRRLRNYVTNKLIMESVDPDPKQRMKALENLGKIASVGLFSERIDINVAHRTVQDIENDLVKTLQMYGVDVEDVEYEETPKSVADINIDDDEEPEPEP